MRSAQRLFVAVMGTWMGLAGIEHGVGEMLQGNRAPEGLMIQSWPDAAFFASLNGEPAMTIIPNLFLTGVLAVVISLLVVGSSIFLAHRRKGGLFLMLLAVPMLLFGGGMFPPVLTFLIGLSALKRPGRRATAGWLGRGWRWIFAACCAAWLALLPGVSVLGYFFGIDRVEVLLAIMAAAFSLLILAYLSSLQHDGFVLESPG